MTTECINCHEQYDDENGECFGHEDAEPGWPVFHTPPPLAASSPSETS